MLGHASIQQTQRYLNLTDEELRKGLEVNLPRGADRELVRDRHREYTQRGSESRTLATVGAFRVVSSRDLRNHDNRPADPRSGDLRHLREQVLIENHALAPLDAA